MTSLSEQDRVQIKQLIKNIDDTSGKVPFVEDLLLHPVYSSFFTAMSSEGKQEIELLIQEYITEKVH